MRLPEDRRNITISFRVNQREVDLIKKQVAKEGWGGRKHTQWIRHVILDRIRQERSENV